MIVSRGCSIRFCHLSHRCKYLKISRRLFGCLLLWVEWIARQTLLSLSFFYFLRWFKAATVVIVAALHSFIELLLQLLYIFAICCEYILLPFLHSFLIVIHYFEALYCYQLASNFIFSISQFNFSKSLTFPPNFYQWNVCDLKKILTYLL